MNYANYKIAMKNFIYITLISTFLLSCATLQNSAKYELVDDTYKLKIDGKKYNCYVENKNDSIIIYKLPSKIATNLPPQVDTDVPTNQRFIKASLDIDVLTALLKIRPEIKNGLPIQLNTNFNGNVYVGHRTDIYHIKYKKNPLDIYKRQINHIGLSGGLFLGLGNTALNPSTTNNAITTEYDGLVLQKGIAGIVAINKLTVGLSMGFDNLLDENKHTWLYQNKSWFGLMLGLNLN